MQRDLSSIYSPAGGITTPGLAIRNCASDKRERRRKSKKANKRGGEGKEGKERGERSCRGLVSVAIAEPPKFPMQIAAGVATDENEE